MSAKHLIALALALAGCGGAPASNVLLITIDTLRPDRLSCYGYTHNQTPNIDALAARGVAFDRAFCDVTWTTPSIASMLTGRYAVHHGLRSSSQRLEATTTLATALRARGYATAAVIGSFPAGSSFGLNQGFELYDETFNASVLKDDDPARFLVEIPPDANEIDRRNFSMLRHLTRAYRPDDEVAARAVRWLSAERREPFLLWVHFFGPHEKMFVHLSKEELCQRVVADYDPDVSAVDAQVGVLLQGLHEAGLDDRTLILLHADHGQMLFEQWYVGHGRDLSEQTLRVPLIVVEPHAGGLARGRHARTFARNVDIFPSIMDLLGLPLPAQIDGQSLRTAVRYPSLSWLPGMKAGETYGETYMSATGLYPERAEFGGREYVFGFVRRGVRTADWKYVESDPVALIDDPSPPVLPPELIAQQRTRALYDLQHDAFESTDASAGHPDVLASLRDKLQAYTRDAHRAPDVPLDDVSKERLRALGYAP